MGAWGTGIYQDDVAEDIKSSYINKQKAGKDAGTALKEVLEENSAELEDDDDRYGAWMALADTMWKYGRLTEEVKEKAAGLIEEEKSHMEERWYSKSDIRKRLQVLDKLKERLESEQPPAKRIPVHKPFVPRWKKGEVYQYRITDMPYSDIRPEWMEFIGWYVLIYVHDFDPVEFTVPGVVDLLSVIYMKLSKEKISSVREFNSMDSWCGGNGRLEYRFKVLERSDRFLKNMECIGVCSDFSYPADEIVADEINDYGHVTWSMIGIDAVDGYLYEKKNREIYRLVGHATGLAPREQVAFNRKLDSVLWKLYLKFHKGWKEYTGLAEPAEGENGHSPYITPWKYRRVYQYKIQEVPAGKERYTGWNIRISVYQLRGMEITGNGTPDIVPDVYIQIVDDKTPMNLWLLENFMPYVCFGWDGSLGHGRYKAVIVETDMERFPSDRLEDADKGCTYADFPERQQEDTFPVELNWDNIVEKSLEGYERELERLGIGWECSTIDVIKKYIEMNGGVEQKLDEYKHKTSW